MWRIDTIYFKTKNLKIKNEDCKILDISDKKFYYLKMFNGKNSKNYDINQDSKLTRLDLCLDTNNQKLLDEVFDFVDNHPKNIKYYRGGRFSGYGVYQTKNSGWTLRLYDKFLESGKEQFKGKMRIEIQLTSKYFKDKKLNRDSLKDMDLYSLAYDWFSRFGFSKNFLDSILEDYVYEWKNDNQVDEFYNFGFVPCVFNPRSRCLIKRLKAFNIDNVNNLSTATLNTFQLDLCMGYYAFILASKKVKTLEHYQKYMFIDDICFGKFYFCIFRDNVKNYLSKLTKKEDL